MPNPGSSQTNGPDIRNWTVMVYMAAGDSHELDTVAVRDLKEMERGVNKSMHLVVQINRHWPGAAQRYEIRPRDGGRPGESVRAGRQPTGETNMGEAKTLRDFVTWATEDYPAKRYFLILWGHAYGLGFGRDHQDALTLKDLHDALNVFKAKRKELWKTSPSIVDAAQQKADGKLEILGANACAMSYLEAAYELRDCAQYMVASQITVPFAGWPYESILPRIDSKITPDQLGTLVVDTYVSQFNDLPGADPLSMTLLNLGVAPRLRGLVENLAVAIDNDINGGGFKSDKLSYFRDIFIGATAGDVRPLIDVIDLCNDLIGDPVDPSPGAVTDAAIALRNALRLPTGDAASAKAKSGTGLAKVETLVAHYRRHRDLDDLNGVGIFAPFVTNPETLERLELQDLNQEKRNDPQKAREKEVAGRDAYEKLDLFRADDQANAPKGNWPNLVYDVLRREIPADLMESIDGIGALQHSDRADVAQIIMAIDSSLNKLDRTLVTAREVIFTKLVENGTATNGAAGRASAKKSQKARTATGQSAYGYDKRGFGLPWLRLVQPLDLESRVATLQQEEEFRRLTGVKNPTAQRNGNGLVAQVSTDLITAVVMQFRRVENAVTEVERTTRRGLTHARFGLGPMNPKQFSLGAEPPKSGEGAEPPKSGEGAEPPKSGEGESRSNGAFPVLVGPGGDLRGDLALARVTDLFRQVGQSLRELEQAATDVETTARTLLIDSTSAERASEYFFKATAQEVERAFHLLEEAATSARRTVRRVLAHPVYGLGPGSEGDLTLEARQELARRGGLDKRHLRLL